MDDLSGQPFQVVRLAVAIINIIIRPIRNGPLHPPRSRKRGTRCVCLPWLVRLLVHCYMSSYPVLVSVGT